MTAILLRFWQASMTKSLVACCCLLGAAGLVLGHVRAIRDVSAVGLPTAARVTVLEQRLELLKQQMQATQAQAALKGDSQDEVIRRSVLPADSDLEHVVSLFDMLRDHLAGDGAVRSMSQVAVGEAVPTAEGQNVLAAPVSVSFTVTRQGLQSVLLFFELSGFLTVGDALTPVEREQLLLLTERENAAGLPALEDFLRTPLLTYARGSQAARDELTRNFGSESFAVELERVIAGSRLPQVRYLLGGTFGSALQEANLWPLRFMTVDRTEVSPGPAGGLYVLSLSLSAYSRAAE